MWYIHIRQRFMTLFPAGEEAAEEAAVAAEAAVGEAAAEAAEGIAFE